MGWFGKATSSSVADSSAASNISDLQQRRAPRSRSRAVPSGEKTSANFRVNSNAYVPPASAAAAAAPTSPQKASTTTATTAVQQVSTDQVPQQQQPPPATAPSAFSKDTQDNSTFEEQNMKGHQETESESEHGAPNGDSYDQHTYDGSDHHQSMSQNHLNSLFNGHLMKWKFEAEEGTIFLRLPSFLGGLAQIGVSVAAFVLDRPDSIEVHAIVMYVCVIILSLMILILDGRFLSSHPLSIRSHLRNILTRNFNILRFLWGRGLLYITTGVLTIGQMYLPCILAGGYLCGVGLLAIVVGVHASRKFAALRNSLADESFLLLVFANYDADADGFIDPREFSWVLIDLGVELDDRYTLKAFNNIDKDGDRLISFEDFSHWWSSGFVERGRKLFVDDDSYRRMDSRV